MPLVRDELGHKSLYLIREKLPHESVSKIFPINVLGSKLAGNSKLWECHCSKGLCLKCSHTFGSSGFDALPGCIRTGGFTFQGEVGSFWTTTEDDSSFLPKDISRLQANYIGINNQITVFKKTEIKWYGFSIRCIKDYNK